MRISIVLPAFNEEKRLGATLLELAAYRESCGFDLEPIVVDDGSTDATYEVAEAHRDALPDLVILKQGTNRGKGRAVANGILTGTGHYRAFFDADGATPFSALDSLVAATESGPQVVSIGSVRAPGAHVTESQSWARSMFGQMGNALIRAMALPGIKDSQRGCKLFPAAVAEIAFGALETDRWGFDIEVLARCRHLGCDITEVPVVWRHVEGSQVGAGAYLSTLGEVVRIRRMVRTWAPAASGAEGRSPVLVTGAAPHLG